MDPLTALPLPFIICYSNHFTNIWRSVKFSISFSSLNSHKMDKTIRFTISISNRRKNNLGNPWGFMIKSGQMPRSENGKSSCWTMVPQTPFCPCLLLNLSPTYMNEIIFQKFRGSSKLTIYIQHENDSITSGLRVWRINDLTHKWLCLSEKRATLSTTQDSPSGPLYFWKADL